MRVIHSLAVYTLGSMLCLGCSSKEPPSANDVQSTQSYQYEESSSYTPVYIPSPNVDTETRVEEEHTQQSVSADNQHNKSVGAPVSVNPYYDKGYENGMEDGYNDGLENCRGSSFDDSNRYRGRNRREYELGYEEGYDAGFDDGYADSEGDPDMEE